MSDAPAREVYAARMRAFRDRARHVASPHRVARLPEEAELVALGPGIVPLLLADIRAGDILHAPLILAAVTGEAWREVIPAGSRGRLREIADAWLAWGERRGNA